MFQFPPQMNKTLNMFQSFTLLRFKGPCCFPPSRASLTAGEDVIFSTLWMDQVPSSPSHPSTAAPPLAFQESMFYQANLRDKLTACLRPFSTHLHIHEPTYLGWATAAHVLNHRFGMSAAAGRRHFRVFLVQTRRVSRKAVEWLK